MFSSDWLSRIRSRWTLLFVVSCSVAQTADEQSLVERLLRDNRVQDAVWLSGRLQQTTNMAYNYRWISGLSSLFDLHVELLPSPTRWFSLSAHTSVRHQWTSRLLYSRPHNALRTRRSPAIADVVYSMDYEAIASLSEQRTRTSGRSSIP